MGLDRWSHLVRYRPKKICRSRANQKFGMDRPMKAVPVATWSNTEYCRRAEYTPMPTPISRENSSAVRPRRAVFRRASRMSRATGCRDRVEIPHWPRTKWESQATYW